jgi:hypothetical protein
LYYYSIPATISAKPTGKLINDTAKPDSIAARPSGNPTKGINNTIAFHLLRIDKSIITKTYKPGDAYTAE